MNDKNGFEMKNPDKSKNQRPDNMADVSLVHTDKGGNDRLKRNVLSLA